VREELAVAERMEPRGSLVVPCFAKRSRLLQESVAKLILDPRFDPPREERPRPADTKSDRLHGGSPALAPERADGLPGDLVDLERADHPDRIAREDLRVALWIDPRELGPQGLETVSGDALREPLADRIISLRPFE